ncbi:MAG: OPT/YSL family transporter [Peptococcaceae bacterium]|nr:OPT/YSL family transporter [Peptococcaceae bacterium]
MENNTTAKVKSPIRGGLSARALVLGALGSALLTASSMYVALRMGALPWPTIFASIAAMSILKLLGGTGLNEINVAQTAMTAGSMIAGGLAFTLPGLWTESAAPVLSESFLTVFLVALTGLILGLALTWYWRPLLLEREKLPFPIGMAAAETIKSGDAGGKKGLLLGLSLAASAVFTFIRDWFGKIPQMLSFGFLAPFHIEAGLMLYPMAPAIGYMIGTLYTGVLFLGGFLAYFLIIPLGVYFGIFADGAAAAEFKNTLGLGLMVGAGIGTLLRFLYGRIKQRRKNLSLVSFAEKKSGKGGRTRLFYGLGALGALICLKGAGLGLGTGFLVLAGGFLMTLMSCLITGETGVDPMEIFGIIVMMGISFLMELSWQSCLLVAAVVAVASGFAGDTMFDYRAGQIIGTDPKEQLIAQGIGGLVGAAVSALTLFVIVGQFGPVFSDALPAPQGAMVFSMVNNAFDPAVFWSGAALGAVMVFFGLPATTLGIGMYLSFAFSAAIFLGGLIRLGVGKARPDRVEEGTVIASGVFGGESLTGMVIAFISFFASL